MYKPPPKTALVSLGASYSIRSKAFGLFVVFGAILLLLAPQVVGAASVTEGFNTSEELPAGTVVSISKADPNLVERTNINNGAYIAGVIAGASDGLVAIGDAATEAFVATSGDTPVLVSTANGSIQKGDLIGPSPISGVAQRTSVVDGGRVLGAALTDFDGSGGETQTVNDQEVTIGLVPVQILLTEVASTDQGTVSFLERIGIAVTGSNVSTIRVIIASIIFVAAMFVSGMMLISSVKGTFESVGRNPMASETIFSHLMHVTVVASTILVIGLIAAYMVMAV